MHTTLEFVVPSVTIMIRYSDNSLRARRSGRGIGQIKLDTPVLIEYNREVRAIAVLTKPAHDDRPSDLFATRLVQSAIWEVVHVPDRVEQAESFGPHPGAVRVHHVDERRVVRAERRQRCRQQFPEQRRRRIQTWIIMDTSIAEDRILGF